MLSFKISALYPISVLHGLHARILQIRNICEEQNCVISCNPFQSQKYNRTMQVLSSYSVIAGSEIAQRYSAEKVKILKSHEFMFENIFSFTIYVYYIVN